MTTEWGLDWAWLSSSVGEIARLLGQHALLAIVPVLVALVIALPLGYAVFRTGRAATPVLAVLGVLHSVPALALLVAVPLLLRRSAVRPVDVALALTLLSVALLVRSVVDGLRSVPDHVRRSAAAVGFGWFRRLVRVELPLAMPAVFAVLRLVTVSNIALVSVAVLVGSGGLGQLFQRGYESRFFTLPITGAVLSVALALLADGLLLFLRRGGLAWTRAGRA